MNAIFRQSFERDLKKIRESAVLAQIRAAIENVEAAAALPESNYSATPP